jgi:hypothetical protein
MFTWPEFFFLKKGAPPPSFYSKHHSGSAHASCRFISVQYITKNYQTRSKHPSAHQTSKPMISLQSFDVITWRPRQSLRSYPSCLQRAPTSPVATHLVSYSPRFSFLANLHSLPPPFSFLPSVTPKNRTCSSSFTKPI